nr:MAG TPA: hypothetical protein [Bacteriophage sp.]
MTIGKVTNTINGVAHERILLTAAEGKALTNDGGITTWNCIAVDNTDGWAEIDAPVDGGEEITDTEALNIITGGATT